MHKVDLDISEFTPEHDALRICVVTETYPPEVNGVALTLAKVVEGLRGSGHHVWLVRPGLPGQTQPSNSDQEQWVRALSLPIYKDVKFGMPSTATLKRLWTRHRPDVVHIATEGPLGWSALRLALRMKIAITSDFRTNFHTYSQHYRLGWLQSPILKYLKKFHNRAASTMVPTQELFRNLQTLGFERLSHVPRGVDLQKFDPSHRKSALRREWGADDDAVVMLCVSRLAAEKNLELVIQSWLNAQKSGIKAKLVLVGDGPMRGELQKNHPDVHFAGFRQEDDLSTHYASADLFVFASITETFGNVTLEAMASGLPVLAFRSAAAGELITDQQEGVLIDQGDHLFMQACAQMAAAPDRLREMGSKGRTKAMQCSWPLVIAKTVQVMQQAVLKQSASA
jgi:glycosyltransferase involved in cell wall biosynthesis